MSSILVRLFEKMTGRPHRHHNSDMVNAVAENLKREVANLSDTMKPYTESDDPLTSLMLDIYNKRQLEDGK